MGPITCLTTIVLLCTVTNARYFGSYPEGHEYLDSRLTDISQPGLSLLKQRYLPEYVIPSSYDVIQNKKRSSIPFLNKRGTFNDLIQRLLALRGDMRSTARKSQMRFGGGRR